MNVGYVTAREVSRKSDGPVRVLFLENDDSFTWNVVDSLPVDRQGICIRAGREVAGDPAAVESADVIIVGPGPTDPVRAGIVKVVLIAAHLGRPLLGICLGHQALGLVHGASVFLGPARREPESIHLLPGHPLVAGLGAEAVFGEDHTEGITCPLGFHVVGFSAHYRVEVMAHARLPLFGVQFHPEISGDPGLCLIGNFLALARQAGSR